MLRTAGRITPWRAFRTDPAEWFAADEIERARRYVKPVNRANMLRSAVTTVAFLCVIGFGVPGHVIRALGAGPWPVRIVVVAAVAVIIETVIGAPFGAWRQLAYDRRWELSNQTPRQFVADQVKSIVLETALLSALGVAIWAVVRATSLWWVYAWIIFAGFSAVLGLLYPVAIAPIFNKFTPLDDADLRSELLAIAATVDADVDDVLVEDTSRRDRRTNAYVAGLGRTRRMVLCDTIVADPVPQLRCVTAHELGHWKLRHLTKALPFSVVVSLATFAVVGAVLPLHAVLRFSHARDLSDPVMFVPFLVAFGAGLSASGLATSWLSRSFERQADLFALETTGDVPAFLEAMRRLYTANLADLTPPWWVRVRASHPLGAERLAMATAWGDRRGDSDKRPAVSVVP